MNVATSRLAKIATWVFVFPTLVCASYFAMETILPAPRPGTNGFRPNGAPIRGFVLIGIALFTTRWLANRIPGPDRRRPVVDTDNEREDF